MAQGARDGGAGYPVAYGAALAAAVLALRVAHSAAGR